MAQLAVAGSSFIQGRAGFGPFALGFGLLLAGGLRGVHVPRCGQQDLFGMVAQRQAVHGFSRGRDGFGKLLPFIDDTVNIVHDEF